MSTSTRSINVYLLEIHCPIKSTLDSDHFTMNLMWIFWVKARVSLRGSAYGGGLIGHFWGPKIENTPVLDL